VTSEKENDFFTLQGAFMPKMKTNRTAFRKFKVGAKGRLRRAQAGTSHNTAKKSAKRIRQLRKIIGVDSTNEISLFTMLPYRARR
jgi:large subunit ribosomal protein L35